MKRLFAYLLGLGVAGASADVANLGPVYQELYRPQFHFSPPQQWMNDPNGMVYVDGSYELFYQYNPYANRWGPMHWGHTVSRDLVHWENKPIALFPDAHGTIFSGSAVLDAGNSSGLGSADKPPLVAIFTYHDHLAENLGRDDFQTQGLAYSLDHGTTWTKYAGNPVLANPGSRDFRDPKVFWSAAARKWVMTLAVHDHVAFYSSSDLKSWSHESDFGKDEGAHGGVWECPDLIEMPVAGTAERRFVLLVSIGTGGPNGGSATQYFVGRFDGHRFEPDTSSKKTQGESSAAWIDYGTDDYAGSTWSGNKPGDERQLFLGWMSNWQYANSVPTERWRSAFTVPRELSLLKSDAGIQLRSLPVRELATLRTHGTSTHSRSVTGNLDLTSPESRTGLFELDLTLDTRQANGVELQFGNSQNQRVIFRINKSARRYEFDRAASGVVNFNPEFAHLQTAPLLGDGAHVTLIALVDRSSIEIFVNGGETVFTDIFFPSAPYEAIHVQAESPVTLRSAAVYGLNSIWQDNVH